MRGRAIDRSAGPPPRAHAALPLRARWYRSPILWLGAAIVAATFAGCIVTIVLALAEADTATPVAGERLLNVPTAPEPRP
jgi:hypothetical protein